MRLVSSKKSQNATTAYLGGRSENVVCRVGGEHEGEKDSEDERRVRVILKYDIRLVTSKKRGLRPIALQLRPSQRSLDARLNSAQSTDRKESGPDTSDHGVHDDSEGDEDARCVYVAASERNDGVGAAGDQLARELYRRLAQS